MIGMPDLIAACFLSFCLGIVGFTVINRILHGAETGQPKRAGEGPPKKSLVRRLGVMNLILILVGVALLAFTLCCIGLFVRYGTIPDTLVTCVFATLGGECGIMGWIKTTKERHREHRWEQEERTEETGAPPDDNYPAG